MAVPATISAMPRFSPLSRTACLACALILIACSPKYNWREVRGTAAPFVVTLPAKPATHARTVNLDGTQVTMTMTGAEVDDVTFAVGSAELADPALAEKSLEAMKTAMVRNIGGTIRHEETSAAGTTPATIDIEAIGAPAPNGRERLLLARFVAKGPHAYQAIVVGNEKDVSREAADTFFASFNVR
jgi:hypothetical protein